jgi:lipoprotein-anchoring transpeptidase ErfK/SrfK
MSGGTKGTSSYYYLPNVPYTMFFYKSYGLHGTYWHNNFGHPMSHGCVNLPTPIAEKLFYWTEPQLPAGKSSVLTSREISGTKVVVHQ